MIQNQIKQLYIHLLKDKARVTYCGNDHGRYNGTYILVNLNDKFDSTSYFDLLLTK